MLKFGSKVGSQSHACTGRSTRSKRQGTGIICVVLHGAPHVLLLFPCTKMTRSTSTKSVIAPTCPIKGVLQGIALATVCEWSSSCCCCGWKCLFVFADRLPWRVRIVSSWMTCEMQLLVGWGSAILQLLCDLFF